MSDDPVERTTDAAGGDWYDAEEARRRGDALVKRMLGTPPKPQKDMKLGKPRNRGAGPVDELGEKSGAGNESARADRPQR